jgi:hypothetical protein
VPGRLTFNSRKLSRQPLTVKVEGDRATVTLGEAGGDDQALLVREEAGWRVSLFAPPKE